MIRLQIDKKDSTYRPGETINGIVQWEQHPGDVLEVRLVWYAEWKVWTSESADDLSSEIVAIHKISPMEADGSDPFQFVAPHRPNTFLGEHFFIDWALEAFVFPEQKGVRMKLVISDTGKAIEPLAALPTK